MLVKRLKKTGRAITGDHSSATSPGNETMLHVSNESSSVQKFRLNFHSVSGEDLSAMASETLHDGGYVEPAPRKPEVGDKMPDGTIFVGISPNTGKSMYATPADAPLSYTFNEAQKYAKDLDAHGHQDWRVPTKSELNLLFSNRAAIGGFNVTGSYAVGWYRSSFPYDKLRAWIQRFSDGYQVSDYTDVHSSLRCIRYRS